VPKTIHTQTYRRLIAAVIEARVAAGLTQQDVADALGRPQSFVAKLEGCERRLDVVEFLEVTAAIGANPMPIIEAAWKDVER